MYDLPGDANETDTATAIFTFDTPGVYQVCYKLHANSTVYHAIGDTLTAIGAPPTAWASDGELTAGNPEVLEFTGGHSLDLRPGADTVKFVTAGVVSFGTGVSCEEAAASGTTEDDALQPDPNAPPSRNAPPSPKPPPKQI